MSCVSGWRSTARILTYNAGIKAKVENVGQYQEYLDELKPIREELGIQLKESLYPEHA